jgi:hypothetical protein
VRDRPLAFLPTEPAGLALASQLGAWCSDASAFTNRRTEPAFARPFTAAGRVLAWEAARQATEGTLFRVETCPGE